MNEKSIANMNIFINIDRELLKLRRCTFELETYNQMK